jgi:hypothetical protein
MNSRIANGVFDDIEAENARYNAIKAYVQMCQTRLTGSIVIFFFMAYGGCWFALVPGFASVSPTGTTAMPHYAFHLAAFFAIMIGLIVSRFDVSLQEKQIFDSFYLLYAAFFVTACAYLASIGFAAYELHECKSLLCTDSKAFLILDLVVCPLQVLLCAVIILFAVIFKVEFKAALDRGYYPRYERTIVSKEPNVVFSQPPPPPNPSAPPLSLLPSAAPVRSSILRPYSAKKPGSKGV